MTFKPPLSVLIQKPVASLSDVMNDARSWLDSREIEPIEFKTYTTEAGDLALEIRFNTEDEAFLFAREFTGWR